jgi:hypothetical protein
MENGMRRDMAGGTEVYRDRGYQDAAEGRYSPPVETSWLFRKEFAARANEAYETGYREGKKKYESTASAQNASSRRIAGVIGDDEVAAATAFEAAAAQLLIAIDDTIADLHRQNEETRAVLARLAGSLAAHGR